MNKEAFELKDGTIIYENDVKCLIINGIEEKYSHKDLFDAAKKTATVRVVLNDDSVINQSKINTSTMFKFN